MPVVDAALEAAISAQLDTEFGPVSGSVLLARRAAIVRVFARGVQYLRDNAVVTSTGTSDTPITDPTTHITTHYPGTTSDTGTLS